MLPLVVHRRLIRPTPNGHRDISKTLGQEARVPVILSKRTTSNLTIPTCSTEWEEAQSEVVAMLVNHMAATEEEAMVVVVVLSVEITTE